MEAKDYIIDSCKKFLLMVEELTYGWKKEVDILIKFINWDVVYEHDKEHILKIVDYFKTQKAPYKSRSRVPYADSLVQGLYEQMLTDMKMESRFNYITLFFPSLKDILQGYCSVKLDDCIQVDYFENDIGAYTLDYLCNFYKKIREPSL